MAQDMMVVGSKVKAYIKEKGGMTSSELLEALSMKMQKMLDEAVDRCKANKRSTVKACDL